MALTGWDFGHPVQYTPPVEWVVSVGLSLMRGLTEPDKKVTVSPQTRKNHRTHRRVPGGKSTFFYYTHDMKCVIWILVNPWIHWKTTSHSKLNILALVRSKILFSSLGYSLD
ncbi:hypothetical protein GDO81_024025 [Engystomops pustulosus]|uniref:Uncharacterized protein n=1 Tax=Engystomops pustulosus TaxID=76066 RepID=A0AAV6YRD5_ENGPU|nr:hypothetical protein GDO81_024025 [Engystomops pustulosus]